MNNISVLKDQWYIRRTLIYIQMYNLSSYSVNKTYVKIYLFLYYKGGLFILQGRSHRSCSRQPLSRPRRNYKHTNFQCFKNITRLQKIALYYPLVIFCNRVGIHFALSGRIFGSSRKFSERPHPALSQQVKAVFEIRWKRSIAHLKINL